MDRKLKEDGLSRQILDYMKSNNGELQTSYSHIATQFGTSVSNAKASIHVLMRRGDITRLRKGTGISMSEFTIGTNQHSTVNTTSITPSLPFSIVLPNTMGLLVDTISRLMDTTPQEFSTNAIRTALSSIDIGKLIR